MQPSSFNVRVPLATGEVFLMNTLTDAQLVVSADAAQMLDRVSQRGFNLAAADPATVEALATYAELGLLVGDRESDRANLEHRFEAFREDTTQLRITVLTTLQCNFACDYCYQGLPNDGAPAAKMSLETSRQVAAWIAAQLELVQPRRLVLTFFGGEPLLNIPAMVDLAGRCWRATSERGVEQFVSIITNGLLLTPAVVDLLLPFGLTGVKVTLDGDRDTHDRLRPMRGGQGTFDRIIANVRRVADQVPVAIGGNFDGATADRYPALLDFLKDQDFSGRLSKVAFKPVIKPAASGGSGRLGSVIPITAVDAGSRPLGGPCMSAAGGGQAASICDGCHCVDEQMDMLRAETKRRGFPTVDGVHMGPCELYRRHSHTIGPDGSLYACPGFTGDNALAVGHISSRPDPVRDEAARVFEHLAPWKNCGDCSFIPVCGGGCAVASHTELGDMAAPSCHKRAFESALTSLAEEAACAVPGGVQ